MISPQVTKNDVLIVTNRPRDGKWRGYIENEGPLKDGNLDREALVRPHPPFVLPFAALLSLPVLGPSLPFHCLCLALPLPFSTAYPWPFIVSPLPILGHSPSFHCMSLTFRCPFYTAYPWTFTVCSLPLSCPPAAHFHSHPRPLTVSSLPIIGLSLSLHCLSSAAHCLFSPLPTGDLGGAG